MGKRIGIEACHRPLWAPNNPVVSLLGGRVEVDEDNRVREKIGGERVGVSRGPILGGEAHLGVERPDMALPPWLTYT
uniref:Uncharacterized protein n=1 Tax=Cannabis sativa TaxID=3483 RepID=A0A803QSN8_CANSA